MANEQSFMNNELQRSSSFLEYCIPSNDSDPNNINKIKVDNFNLRLRCYNMSELLENCTCSKNLNDKNSSISNNINKFDKYFENQKVLKNNNSILQEENEMLKAQLNELKVNSSKLSQFNSLKLKCEHLTKLLNENIPGNEILQEMIRRNDKLDKLYIEAKEKITHLETQISSLKKHSNSINFSMKSNESKNFQSKLKQYFDESLELSKDNVEGCSHCNALKVNYQNISDLLLKSVEENEKTLNDLKLKDSIIRDLELEIEKSNTKPVVKEEKLKKYQMLLKDALISIVKKDKEKIGIRNESKEVINFQIDEIGKLRRKIESLNKLGQDNLIKQTEAMNILSSLINVLFKKLSIDKEVNISSKSIRFGDSCVSEIKKNWDSIISSVDQIREHLMTKSHPDKPVVYNNEENISYTQNKNNDSLIQEQTENVSMGYILNKFNEVKEITDSFRDVSCHFNTSQAESHLSHSHDFTVSESERYSPQYRLGYTVNVKHLQNQSINDPFASICYDKDSLNNTAYRSFTTENWVSENFNRATFETLIQKINELGDVIHKYSEIVRDLKFNEETLKADKSCLAIFEESKDKADEFDSYSEELKMSEINKSQDLSVLKILYHDEKDKFKREVNEKDQVILTLKKELSLFKEKIFENEIINSNLDKLQLKLTESEEEIHNLNFVIENCRSSHQLELENLYLKINRLQEEMDKQNINNDIKVKELQSDLSESGSQLTKYDKKINELILEKETLSREISELSEYLSSSIKQIKKLQDDLNEAEIDKSALEKQIVELEININNLSEEKDNLEIKINHEQKNNQDLVSSLSNLTETIITMTTHTETLSDSINKVYNTMLSMKLIISDVNNTKMDTIEMLNVIEESFSKINTESKSNELKGLVDSLIASEKNYYESAIEQHKNVQPISSSRTSDTKSVCSSLNDLTNITSFNTNNESENIGPTITKVIDMTGFKIKTTKDVIDNPEKVVIMLRKYVKDIEDLKRRLLMRYEENKQLKQIISSNTYASNICESLSKKMEKLKEECSINNENVEKVVKRNSKS